MLSVLTRMVAKPMMGLQESREIVRLDEAAVSLG